MPALVQDVFMTYKVAPINLYHDVVLNPWPLINELRLMIKTAQEEKVDVREYLETRIVGGLEEAEAALIARVYGYSATSTQKLLEFTNATCFIYDLMYRLLFEAGCDVEASGVVLPLNDIATIVANEQATLKELYGDQENKNPEQRSGHDRRAAEVRKPDGK